MPEQVANIGITEMTPRSSEISEQERGAFRTLETQIDQFDRKFRSKPAALPGRPSPLRLPQLLTRSTLEDVLMSTQNTSQAGMMGESLTNMDATIRQVAAMAHARTGAPAEAPLGTSPQAISASVIRDYDRWRTEEYTRIEQEAVQRRNKPSAYTKDAIESILNGERTPDYEKWKKEEAEKLKQVMTEHPLYTFEEATQAVDAAWIKEAEAEEANYETEQTTIAQGLLPDALTIIRRDQTLSLTNLCLQLGIRYTLASRVTDLLEKELLPE